MHTIAAYSLLPIIPTTSTKCLLLMSGNTVHWETSKILCNKLLQSSILDSITLYGIRLLRNFVILEEINFKNGKIHMAVTCKTFLTVAIVCITKYGCMDHPSFVSFHH